MADEDGWVGLDYNSPLVYDQNFALAGFDRTHVFQMGFVYALPWLQDSQSVAGTILGGWQINGIFGAYSGTPYSIGGTNNALNCPSCGSIRIDVNGDIEPTGTPGSATEDYYARDVCSRSRAGVNVAGLRQQRPQRVPPSAGLEHRPVAVQAVPDRPVPSGAPDRGLQRLQSHDVGCAGHRHHLEHLHAVSAGRREQRDQHARHPPRAGRAARVRLLVQSGGLRPPDPTPSLAGAPSPRSAPVACSRCSLARLV